MQRVNRHFWPRLRCLVLWFPVNLYLRARVTTSRLVAIRHLRAAARWSRTWTKLRRIDLQRHLFHRRLQRHDVHGLRQCTYTCIWHPPRVGRRNGHLEEASHVLRKQFMRWMVGVQNNFLHHVRPTVKEHVHSQVEVIVEIISRSGVFGGGRMDFHRIVVLGAHLFRWPEIGEDILRHGAEAKSPTTQLNPCWTNDGNIVFLACRHQVLKGCRCRAVDPHSTRHRSVRNFYGMLASRGERVDHVLRERELKREAGIPQCVRTAAARLEIANPCRSEHRVNLTKIYLRMLRSDEDAASVGQRWQHRGFTSCT
mmetsp:Transcript_27215/g.71661  ORF Transcript_27215/g.71661 Transcript_27215/m.71661 type:complete len:311 (-) Transcript_27215:329-1261(-)